MCGIAFLQNNFVPKDSKSWNVSCKTPFFRCFTKVFTHESFRLHGIGCVGGLTRLLPQFPLVLDWNMSLLLKLKGSILHTKPNNKNNHAVTLQLAKNVCCLLHILAIRKLRTPLKTGHFPQLPLEIVFQRLKQGDLTEKDAFFCHTGVRISEVPPTHPTNQDLCMYSTRTYHSKFFAVGFPEGLGPLCLARVLLSLEGLVTLGPTEPKRLEQQIGIMYVARRIVWSPCSRF